MPPSVVEDRPPASERPVPTGEISVACFASPVEHTAGLLHAVTTRLAAALAERWALGMLPEVGAPGAELYDRARVELMLVRAGASATDELARRRAEVVRQSAIYDARIAASRTRGIALPLAEAFDAWGLGETDRWIVACLLAAELSPTLARLLAYLGGDPSARPVRPVAEAVAAVVRAGDGGMLELGARLAHGAPLARLALVEVGGNPSASLLQRPLVLAPRVAALARGALALDDALAGDGVALTRERVPSLAVQVAPPELYQRLRGVFAGNGAQPVVVLHAARGCGGAAIVADAALSVARPVLWLAEHAVSGDARWQDAITREALLHRAVVLIEIDSGGAAEPCRRLLHRLAAASLSVAVIAPHAAVGIGGLPTQRFELPLPTTAERVQLWRLALASVARDPDLDAAAFATPRIGAAAIAQAVAHAQVLAAGRTVRHADVIEAMRAMVPDELAAAATRIATQHAWDDLVLAADIHERVLGLLDELRARRLLEDSGAVALLCGAPGTGKTLIGSLFAREHGVDLLELDAARLGEHSDGRRVAEAALAIAEAGLAIVALTRAELAPDWLATLLQRPRGVVLLASCVAPDAIAPALRRCAATTLVLRPPTRDERARLWAQVLAAEPRVRAIRLPEQVLELPLTGGEIGAIVRRAAALADASRHPVTPELVAAFARRAVSQRAV